MSVFIAYLLIFILFAAFKISVSEILVLFEIFRNGYVPTGIVAGNYTMFDDHHNTSKKENVLFIV